MRNMFPHQDVILIVWWAPVQHEAYQRRTRISPETFFGYDGLDKVGRNFGVITRQSFYNKISDKTINTYWNSTYWK